LIPVSEGGTDSLKNLCLACFHCNRRKSARQTAFDKETGKTVPIFDPRQAKWTDHFIWSADGLYIIPLTAIGRVTVDLLDLNRERILNIRQADIIVDRHPPADDPIQREESRLKENDTHLPNS
jgi:HNH endonuclease